jgi:hypothetical protein
MVSAWWHRSTTRKHPATRIQRQLGAAFGVFAIAPRADQRQLCPPGRLQPHRNRGMAIKAAADTPLVSLQRFSYAGGANVCQAVWAAPIANCHCRCDGENGIRWSRDTSARGVSLAAIGNVAASSTARSPQERRRPWPSSCRAPRVWTLPADPTEAATSSLNSDSRYSLMGNRVAPPAPWPTRELDIHRASDTSFSAAVALMTFHAALGYYCDKAEPPKGFS